MKAKELDLRDPADGLYDGDVKVERSSNDLTFKDTANPTALTLSSFVNEADTSTAAMGIVLDEDTMSSDSATKLATQQSIKAYIDAGGGGVLGILANANEWAKTQSANISALSGDPSFTWDGEIQWATITLTADGTLANMTDVKVGAHYALKVIQGGAGGFALTYGSNYKFIGSSAPDHTPRATGEYDIVGFMSWTATELDGTEGNNFG